MVRKMMPGEKGKVARFINRAMHEQYGCDAHALPETVFVAIDDRAMVGAIGLSLQVNGALPLEHIYRLDWPAWFDRCARMVQFGRWVAAVPNAASLLMEEAIDRARRDGYVWGVGEAKPSVARRFMRIGIRAVRIPGEILYKNIPSNVLPYYVTPPRPSVYAFPLAEYPGRL